MLVVGSVVDVDDDLLADALVQAGAIALMDGHVRGPERGAHDGDADRRLAGGAVNLRTVGGFKFSGFVHFV